MRRDFKVALGVKGIPDGWYTWTELCDTCGGVCGGKTSERWWSSSVSSSIKRRKADLCLDCSLVEAG